MGKIHVLFAYRVERGIEFCTDICAASCCTYSLVGFFLLYSMSACFFVSSVFPCSVFFIFALCMSFAQQSLHKINSTVDSSWNCCCSCVVVERRKNHRFFIVSLLWLLFLFLFLNCFFFALKEGIPANSHYWHTFYSIGCFKSPRKIENSFKAGKKRKSQLLKFPYLYLLILKPCPLLPNFDLNKFIWEKTFLKKTYLDKCF